MKNKFAQRLQTVWKKLAIWIRPYQERVSIWWRPQHEKLLVWYQKALQHWSNLAPREKYSVIGGSVVASLILLYTLIWSPITSQIITLREQIPREQKTLAWMKEADKQIELLKKDKISSGNKSLSLRLNTVQEKIQHSPMGKNLTQLTQLNTDEIHCTFNNVDFDKLVTWLIDFSQQENISIEQASVHRTNAPGIVQAEFVVRVNG